MVVSIPEDNFWLDPFKNGDVQVIFLLKEFKEHCILILDLFIESDFVNKDYSDH